MVTLREGGGRRAVLPLTLSRRVRSQPETPKLEEVELSDTDIQNAAQNRAAENAQAAFQSTALEAAEAQQSGAQLNEESLELDKAANANREESQVIAADQSVAAINEQFAPDRADISTFQALQSNPRYQGMEPAELWEIARQQEGARNGAEFNRKVSTLPQQQGDEMAPMIAGLQREGLDPQVFKDMLDAVGRDDDSIYSYSLDQRQSANRVINGVQGNTLNKSVQQMAAEGASEDELVRFMDAGYQEGLESKTTIPTWDKNEDASRRWGDQQQLRIIKNAQRLRGLEPGLTFEDAQQLAFNDLAEESEDFAGRFREYEKLDAVTPSALEKGPETFEDAKRLAEARGDDGGFFANVKDFGGGVKDVGQGAVRIANVARSINPTSVLGVALGGIREAGEATLEVMEAAVRGDFDEAQEEVSEGLRETSGVGTAAVALVSEPVEAVVEITREAIQRDLAGVLTELQEAGEEVPQVGQLREAWGGLNQMFEGEQKIITPFTQPLIQQTLEAFQVPEDNARGLSLFMSEILVLSTFIAGVGAIGKVGKGVKLAARMKKLLPTAMAEGVVNMLQNRAGKKTRGEEAPGPVEDALMAAGGFGAIFGLDFVTRKLGDQTSLVRQTMRFFNQETGGATTRLPGQAATGQAIPGNVPLRAGAGEQAAEVAGDVVPGATRAIPEADEPGITTLYHGTSTGRSVETTGILPDGANLTPSKTDAQAFADADARFQRLENPNAQPVVLEVRVREGSTRPIQGPTEGNRGVAPDSSLAAQRGAVEVVDPENAFVVPRDAGTTGAPPVGAIERVQGLARGVREAVTGGEEGATRLPRGRGGDAENVPMPGRRTRLPSRVDTGGFAQLDDAGRAQGNYFITPEGRIVGEPGLSHAEVIARDADLRAGVDARNLETVGEPLAAIDDVTRAIDAGNTRIAVSEGVDGVEVGIEATSKAKLDEAVSQVKVDLPNARIFWDSEGQSGVIEPTRGRGLAGRAADFLGGERGALVIPAELSKSKPRFAIGDKKFIPEFESDLDRSLYIVRDSAKRSKRDEDFMEILRDEFPEATDEEIRAAGDLVKENIRKVADESAPGNIEIPDTGARGLFDEPTAPDAGRGNGSEGSPKASGAPQNAGLDEAAVIPKEQARNPDPTRTTTEGGTGDISTDEFIDNARVASGGGGSVNNVPPTKIPGDDEMDAVGILQEAAIQHKATRASGEANAVAAGREINGLADRVLAEETTQTAGVGIPQNPLTAKVGLGGEQGKAKIRPGQIVEEGKNLVRSVKERLQRGTGDKRIVTDDGDLSTSFGVTKVAPDDPMPARWENVVEKPQKFNVPSKTQDMIDYYNVKVREMLRLMIDRNVAGAEEWMLTDKTYARRIVARIGDIKMRIGPKPGIGAKQGFEFARTQDFVKQGDELQYANSMAGSLEVFIKETYQKIAGIDLARTLGIDGDEWLRVSDDVAGDPIRALEILQNRKALGVRTLKTPKDIKANLNIATNAQKNVQREINRTAAKMKQLNKDIKRTGSQKLKNDLAKLDDQMDDALAQKPLVDSNLEEAQKISAAARVKASRARPGEGTIREPIFGGKVVKKEAADTFQAQFGTKPLRQADNPAEVIASGMEWINTVQDPIRSVWANVDVSFMGLQTLASFGKNPRGWLEVMGRTMGAAFLDPKYRTEFFVKNREWVDTWRAGGGILHAGTTPLQPEVRPEGAITGRLFGGAGKKGIALPFKTSMDMWNNAIDMMNISTLKQVVRQAERNGISMADLSAGYREGFPNIVKAGRGKGIITTGGGRGVVTDLKNVVKGEKPTISRPTGMTTGEGDALSQIVASISHFGGQMTIPETARLGVKTNLALRALPFAGRYWLGWSKAIAATVTKGGYEGKVAREMFAGWLIAGVGMYTMASFAMGQTPNLDPRRRDFMTLTIAGQKVGVGGPLQQTIALADRLADAKSPKDALDIQTRWLRGKTAPFLSMAADILMKETFLGDPVDWQKPSQMVPWIAGQLAPFTLQDPLFEGTRAAVEGKGPGTIAGVVGEALKGSPISGVGLRGFPESPFDKRDQKARELFPDQNVDYSDLLTSQKREVDAALPEVEGQLDEEQARQRENEEVLNTAFALSNEFQEKNIATLAKAAVQVTTGNLNHKQFRDVVGNLDMKARGQRDVINALMIQAGVADLDGPEQPHDNPGNDLEQTQNDLWEYFRIFAKYPDVDFDPDQKSEMFEEIDRFRSNTLTPAREDRMDAEIGIDKSTVKLYATLRQDRGDITDSGFFDLSDEAWDTLRTRATVDLPATRGEFLDQLERETAEKFKGQFGDLPPEALSVLYANNPALRAHAALLEGSRTKFLRDNPAITELVLKWGYLPSSKTNLNIIGAQQGTSAIPIGIGGGSPSTGGGGGSPSDQFLGRTGGGDSGGSGGSRSPSDAFLGR